MKNKLVNMKCLDLFIYSQTEKEYVATKQFITPLEIIKYPLLDFGLYLDYFSAKINKLAIRNDIHKIKELAIKFKWKNDLASIFKNEKIETIIITNKAQEIIWVNDGFKKMTGYSKSFALKKTPKFLQGEKTSRITKNRIHGKILIDQPFSDVILNYRKDNTPFECEIKVFPLYHENTTHYLALERSL